MTLLSSILCEDLITNDGADKIRQTGATWDVVDPDQSIFKGVSKDEFASRLQSSWPNDTTLPQLEFDDNVTTDGSRLLQGYNIPTTFDGRREWGKCIHSGRDQIKCNGCWAFSVTNHLSDRFCIKGWDTILSVQDLLECTTGNKCCSGGSAQNAYNYLMQTGVVDEGCKPFDSRCNECRPKSCTKYKCVRNSAWVTADATKAKREIYQNGPIAAIFDVYEDFAYYNGGVYYHASGSKTGIHSVSVVGWGMQNGMQYWLCKNSWGDKWGDEGFFKIKIGDSAINSYMTSCKPQIQANQL